MSSNIIIGTPLFDELFGSLLDDEIYGLEGDDILWGGDGDDLLDGGDGADQLFGEAGDDTLIGGGGNDLLDGGSGNDIMSGGTGDDSYYVDSAQDVVTENDSEGIDTVYSTIHKYTLSENVENLILGNYATSGTGNDQDNYLYGNDGFNILNGGAGNDYLDGGAFSDAMYGGTGDDTYVVDDRDDQVFEAIGEGFDTVIVAVNQYVMPYNVEVLQIADHERRFSTAWGNHQDNIMIGLDGKADTLNGLDGDDILDGGSGRDHLDGGLGNDIYYVDHSRDSVSERVDAENEPFYDVIYASTDYQIAIGVEELILTGDGDFSATGRNSDDILTGNSGNNLLDGGAGDDVMAGGAGDDVYVVDSAGDTIVEYGNEGRDRIESSVDFLLWRDANNVEDLTLTGTGNIQAVGSWRHNTIVGNDGNNQIIGGKGNDTLTGGAGNDVFFFHKNHGDNVVTDFSDGADKIQFAGTSAQSFDDLTVVDMGSGTEVSIDQVTVFLEGVSAASLDAGDFIIS